MRTSSPPTTPHRFFAAPEMTFRTAALSFRFRLVFRAAFAAGADWPRTFAHLRCWATRMRISAAALNLRFFLPVAGSAVQAGAGFSMAQNSAI